MANLNRIILVGRLTADPEARSTMEGLLMAKFSLAVNRPFGGTDFIDIVAWRKEAEICRDYLKKGQMILVEGRIQVRSFEDQAGQRRWATEVVARSIQMMEKSQSQAEHQPVQVATNNEPEDDLGLAEDLPF